MKNVIDLVPYLPQTAAVLRFQRRRKRFEGIVAVIESVVTLCIGAAFVLFVIAFLSVL